MSDLLCLVGCFFLGGGEEGEFSVDLIKSVFISKISHPEGI